MIESLQSKIEIMQSTMPFLVHGLWITFQISLITIICGSIIGFVIGLVRAEKIPLLSLVFGGYIHILRGTPFLVHLYFVYFMLPSLGISWLQLEAFPAAVIALSLYTSTYVAEIVRAAIENGKRPKMQLHGEQKMIQISTQLGSGSGPLCAVHLLMRLIKSSATKA